MKKAFSILGLAGLVFMPLAAHAQLTNLENLVDSIGNIVDVATPIIVGIALLAFFWGLATFIFNAGNEEKREGGKKIMIWGIIALFVMISIWGIVGFIADALGVQQGGDVPVPSVPL